MAMVEPNYASINSLSPEDKKRIKNAIQEVSDSLTRIAAERDLQKEIVGKIAEDLNVDKKLLKRMGKTYYNASFNKESQEQDEFESFYEMIINNGSAQ